MFGLQIIFIYIVFTFIGNKNLRYTLPLLPFLAIIMGYGATKLLTYGRKGKLLLAGFFIFSLIFFTVNSFGFPIKANLRLSIDLNKVNNNLDNFYLLDSSSKDIPYLFVNAPLVENEIVTDLANQQLFGQTNILVDCNNPYISVAGLDLFNKNKNLHFTEVPTDNTDTLRGQKMEDILNKSDFLLIPNQIVAPPGQINYFNLDEIRKYLLSGQTRNFALIKTYKLQNDDLLYLLKKNSLYNTINVQAGENLLITRPEAIANIYLQFMDSNLGWHQEIIRQNEVRFEKKLTNISRFRIDYPPYLIKPLVNDWTYNQDKQFDRIKN